MNDDDDCWNNRGVYFMDDLSENINFNYETELFNGLEALIARNYKPSLVGTWKLFSAGMT